MPIAIPIISIILALIADEARRTTPPSSIEDLLDRINRKWPEAGLSPLSIEDERDLVNLVHVAWNASKGWPITIPEAEVIEDPFKERRAKVDLALSWPESQESPEPPQVVHSRPGDLRVAFPDVHKDPDGSFWVDVDADPVLAVASGGEPVGDPHDMARSPRPYWVTKTNVGTKLYLEPVANNPLRTGVGAGGATITQHDLNVLSGKTEHDLVTKKQALLQSGQATIDNVKYLLLGTVPLQFGPNGAQGGWYNAYDTRSNRGAGQGLDATEIVWRDAWTLKRWGFSVPRTALVRDGLPEDLWTRWVEGPQTDLSPEQVADPIAYVRFLREWVRKGVYRYDEETLREIVHKGSKPALETFLDRDLTLFLRDTEAWKLKHPYCEARLPEVVARHLRLLSGQEAAISRRGIFDLEGEDSSSDESIKRFLYHSERRVSVRNAVLAVHRAQLGSVDPRWAQWRDILLEWTRRGQSDWLAHEQAIMFFGQMKDVEGLKAALKLPDPTNRKYAVASLIRLVPEAARQHLVEVEDHPEVMKDAIHGWRNIFGVDSARDLVRDMRIEERLEGHPKLLTNEDPFIEYEWRSLRDQIEVLARTTW